MDESDELSQQIDKDSKDILERIMNDGTFDSIRQKVMEQLKQDAELKKTVQGMVTNSKALQSVDVTPTNRKQVLDSIRKELEEQLLEEASSTAWSIMCSENSDVAKLIDDKVHESLCTLYEQHWIQAQASYAAQQQQQQRLEQQHPCSTSVPEPPPAVAASYGGTGYEYSQQQQQHYAAAGSEQYYHPQQYNGATAGPHDYMYGHAGQVAQHGGYYEQQQQQQHPPPYGHHAGMQHGGYANHHQQWHGPVHHQLT